MFFIVAYFTPTPSTSSPFLTSLTEKLHNTNYLFQQQQIEHIIKTRKLQHFVVNLVIPPQYLIETYYQDGKVNPAYEAWEVQDQLLLTWLYHSYRNSFSLGSLATLIHIRYGTKLMSTFICRRRHTFVNFAPTFEPPLLMTKR